jgi:hypothetical protein
MDPLAGSPWSAPGGVAGFVSTPLMRGPHFVVLPQLRAVTAIFTLLYLPIGMFFHVFQRPAPLGVDFGGERRSALT